MKLDKIDKKILYSLSENCRKPINQMAKELRLSKGSIIYRIKKMESNKIISSYETIINYRYLGIMYGRVRLKLSNLSPEQFKEQINFLRKIPNIGALLVVESEYNIATVILFRNVKQFYDTLQQIKFKMGKWIEAHEISLASCVYHCSPNTLFDLKFIEPVAVQYFGERGKIDQVDMRILHELKDNARISISELAKKCRISVKTLINRKKKLEANNTILRYKAVINTSILNYESYHIFWYLYDFNMKNLMAFKNYILQMRETKFVTDTLSDSSFDSEFLVRNQRELIKLIEGLKEKFPRLIKSNTSMLMYEEYKYY